MIEQLAVRELEAACHARDAARLREEYPADGAVYVLPTSDTDFVIAADVDASRVRAAIETSPMDLILNGSSSVLLNQYDMRTLYLLEQLFERQQAFVPEGVRPVDIDELLRHKTTHLKRKVSLATLGSMTTGIAADLMTPFSTPVGTETSLIGGTAFMNGSRMLAKLNAMQLKLRFSRNRLQFIGSDELAEASSRLQKRGKKYALQFLDDADDIPEPGYTPDRLNLAEMLMWADVEDSSLLRRISSVSSEIAHLVMEYKHVGQILKATLLDVASAIFRHFPLGARTVS